MLPHRTTNLRTAITGLLLASILPLIPAAEAAEGASKARPIKITHIAPRAKDLPAPGAPLKLSLQLEGVRDTERTVTAVVVQDGVMTKVAATGGFLNEYERPAFELALTAPLAELSYQFIVHSPDGTVTPSVRYSVRRPCLPEINLTKLDLPPEASGKERLTALVDSARGLEQDLDSYERALKTLGQLQELMEHE